MKIFTGNQIKELDQYTIEHEPIESIALMERASEAMAQVVAQEIGKDKSFVFAIGKGNNGGDGLAMARILANAGFDCSVWMIFGQEELSNDCLSNFQRLPESVRMVAGIAELDEDNEIVIIDALLGSGVRGKITGKIRETIAAVNESGCYVISIDLPSGMKTEFDNDPDEIVHADLTLTIQFPKLAMLLPEAGECCGDIRIIPIGCSEQGAASMQTPYNYVSKDLFFNFNSHRLRFSHKGNYGHALLICGSKGMYGASVLSTGAALRSGCGLVTTHIPSDGAIAIYSNAPSAMVSSDRGECFSELPDDQERFDAIGIGCGLGQAETTKASVKKLLSSYNGKMVIDADALNIIASEPETKKLIPAGSILTPHPGEFKRLMGEWGGEQEKITKLQALARELKSVIVLKGAYTMICDADGNVFFNSSGTPGMAKGGSGDVLTGLLAGLLARGYEALEAAILGAYLHGIAGEKAADYYGIESMNSSDIADFLGDAFNELN